MQGLQRWAVLPAWVGRAAAGLLGGAIVGYTGWPYVVHFMRMRAPGATYLIAPIVGGVVGIVAGLMYGRVADQRAAARRADLAENASRLGAQLSDDEPQVAEHLRTDFPQRSLGMRNVLRKQFTDLLLMIGDLSSVESSGDGGRTTRQTAAYYRRADISFPSFRLQPTGLAMKLLAAATGVHALRFPDQPQFESQYFVLATDVTGARAVLNAEVLGWLTVHVGCYVEAGGHGVIVYRRGKLLESGELESFIAEASEFFRLIEKSARAAGLKPAAPLITKNDVHAFAAQMPSWAARSYEKEALRRLVTREHVQAFARQTPPRKVPRNIALQYEGSWTIAFVGFAFVLVGGFFAVLFLKMGQRGGAVMGALFFLGGLPMLFFGARSWLRQRDLFRRGELSVATIESIRDAGWRDDAKGEAFNVSVRYHVAGQARLARGKMWGAAGQAANDVAAPGKPVAILYDPAHPDRIVVLDGLVNAA